MHDDDAAPRAVERVVEEPDDLPPAGPNIDFTDPNSPLAPYYVRASHVFAVLVVALLFVFFNYTPLAHADIWAHMKVGDWILREHRFPDRELFSDRSDPQSPASNFQWLSQVIFELTFRSGAWLAGGSELSRVEGGVEMLRFLHGLCQAAKAIFLLLAFRRLAGSLPVAIVGVGLVFAFSLAPSSIQRPQVFAEVLFAGLLWLLARPMTGDDELAPLPWRRTALIPVLLALWANLHGSFFIGVALVGVFWAGSVIEALRRRGVRAAVADGSLHRPLAGLVAGVVLLSLVNPHGIHAIPDVLAFANNPNVLTMQEWRPLEFSRGPGGHWGYLALLAVILVTQLASPRLFRPTQLLILFSAGIGPLFQERLMTWWYMLVPVVLLPAWADLVAGAIAQRWTTVLSFRKTVIAAGIVLVALVWSNPVQLALGNPTTSLVLSTSPATLWPLTPDLLAGRPGDPDDDARVAASPLGKALKDALANYPDGRYRGRIFTTEGMADYLVWSLPSPAPVMVYSHVHVFPPRHWDDYTEVLFGFPGWRTVLDNERINLVVCQVDRKKLLEKLQADPDWTILLDQTDDPRQRGNRIFAALRKQPLESRPLDIAP